jgi:hypothetical protein
MFKIFALSAAVFSLAINASAAQPVAKAVEAAKPVATKIAEAAKPVATPIAKAVEAAKATQLVNPAMKAAEAKATGLTKTAEALKAAALTKTAQALAPKTPQPTTPVINVDEGQQSGPKKWSAGVYGSYLMLLTPDTLTGNDSGIREMKGGSGFGGSLWFGYRVLPILSAGIGGSYLSLTPKNGSNLSLMVVDLGLTSSLGVVGGTVPYVQLQGGYNLSGKADAGYPGNYHAAIVLGTQVPLSGAAALNVGLGYNVYSPLKTTLQAPEVRVGLNF